MKIKLSCLYIAPAHQVSLPIACRNFQRSLANLSDNCNSFWLPFSKHLPSFANPQTLMFGLSEYDYDVFSVIMATPNMMLYPLLLKPFRWYLCSKWLAPSIIGQILNRGSRPEMNAITWIHPYHKAIYSLDVQLNRSPSCLLSGDNVGDMPSDPNWQGDHSSSAFYMYTGTWIIIFPIHFSVHASPGLVKIHPDSIVVQNAIP